MKSVQVLQVFNSFKSLLKGILEALDLCSCLYLCSCETSALIAQPLFQFKFHISPNDQRCSYFSYFIHDTLRADFCGSEVTQNQPAVIVENLSQAHRFIFVLGQLITIDHRQYNK